MIALDRYTRARVPRLSNSEHSRSVRATPRRGGRYVITLKRYTRAGAQGLVHV